MCQLGVGGAGAGVRHLCVSAWGWQSGREAPVCVSLGSGRVRHLCVSAWGLAGGA